MTQFVPIVLARWHALYGARNSFVYGVGKNNELLYMCVSVWLFSLVSLKGEGIVSPVYGAGFVVSLNYSIVKRWSDLKFRISDRKEERFAYTMQKVLEIDLYSNR